MAAAVVCLLAAHLLAMNVASVAPLISVWLHVRWRRLGDIAGAVGWQLAWVSLAALGVGAAFGFALAGIASVDGDRSYWNAVERFPVAAYGYALCELLFTAICLAVYAAMWKRWRERYWLHSLIAVLGTTNLLYHFPPLMIVLGDLASRPTIVSDEVITRPVFRRLVLRPEVLAQILHFVVASAAVSGVALMVAARVQLKRAASGKEPQFLISSGARIALAASLIQLAVGAWVLVQLPDHSRVAILGGDGAATGLFLLSVIAAFGVLYSLAAVSLGDTSGLAVWRIVALMLSVVLMMSGTLWRVRSIEASISQQTALVQSVWPGDNGHLNHASRQP